eukprot:m.221680 g.221680  ORF g.221680 m.221680 type:complete len:181 (+) comp15865_c0_seq1:103-645(+)
MSPPDPSLTTISCTVACSAGIATIVDFSIENLQAPTTRDVFVSLDVQPAHGIALGLSSVPMPPAASFHVSALFKFPSALFQQRVLRLRLYESHKVRSHRCLGEAVVQIDPNREVSMVCAPLLPLASSGRAGDAQRVVQLRVKEDKAAEEFAKDYELTETFALPRFLRLPRFIPRLPSSET